MIVMGLILRPGIGTEDHVRLQDADGLRDPSGKGRDIGKGAVRQVVKKKIGSADDSARGLGFLPAQGGDLRKIELSGGISQVSVCNGEVSELTALCRKRGGGPAHADLDVVGMGLDAQRLFRVSDFRGHKISGYIHNNLLSAVTDFLFLSDGAW